MQTARLDLDPEARQTQRLVRGKTPLSHVSSEKPQTDSDSLRTFSRKRRRVTRDFTGWTWIDFPLAPASSPSPCVSVIYQVDFPFKPVIQHCYLSICVCVCVRSSILRTHRQHTIIISLTIVELSLLYCSCCSVQSNGKFQKPLFGCRLNFS